MNNAYFGPDARPSPSEIVRDHGRLRDAVEPLVILASTQPNLLQHVIELAMTMGVAAAYTNVDQQQRRATTFMENLPFAPRFFPERRRRIE